MADNPYGVSGSDQLWIGLGAALASALSPRGSGNRLGRAVEGYAGGMQGVAKGRAEQQAEALKQQEIEASQTHEAAIKQEMASKQAAQDRVNQAIAGNKAFLNETVTKTAPNPKYSPNLTAPTRDMPFSVLKDYAQKSAQPQQTPQEQGLSSALQPPTVQSQAAFGDQRANVPPDPRLDFQVPKAETPTTTSTMTREQQLLQQHPLFGLMTNALKTGTATPSEVIALVKAQEQQKDLTKYDTGHILSRELEAKGYKPGTPEFDTALAESFKGYHIAPAEKIMEGRLKMVQMRPISVYDPQTKSTYYATVKDINDNPGRFASASEGVKLQIKHGIFDEIDGSVSVLENAAEKIDFTNTQLAKFSYIFKEPDVRSAVDNFKKSEAAKLLTEPEIQYMDAVRNLVESAQAMRTAGGAGAQSSDLLRQSIIAMVPGIGTGSKYQFDDQMKLFKLQSAKLRGGLAGVGVDQPPLGQPQTPSPGSTTQTTPSFRLDSTQGSSSGTGKFWEQWK